MFLPICVESQLTAISSIDGVLLRSNEPIAGAREALLRLQKEQIPYIFLTNGGGKTEADRAADLSEILGIPINPETLIQSHTPFKALEEEKKKTVLVVGGDDDKCRHVAERSVDRREIRDIALANDLQLWLHLRCHSCRHLLRTSRDMALFAPSSPTLPTIRSSSAQTHRPRQTRRIPQDRCHTCLQ